MGLTDAQLEKLNRNRKLETPNYYDSNDSNTYPIPSVTEDALILLSTSAKRKAISYLNAYVNSTPGVFTQNYNDLLGEFIEQQVSNSASIIAELEQVTGKFNDFRTTLTGEMTETNLTIEEGLQPVMAAMGKTMGRLNEINNSEFFHDQFNSVMQGQFKQEVTNELKKELRSWLRVIASYP